MPVSYRTTLSLMVARASSMQWNALEEPGTFALEFQVACGSLPLTHIKCSDPMLQFVGAIHTATWNQKDVYFCWFFGDAPAISTHHSQELRIPLVQTVPAGSFIPFQKGVIIERNPESQLCMEIMLPLWLMWKGNWRGWLSVDLAVGLYHALRIPSTPIRLSTDPIQHCEWYALPLPHGETQYVSVWAGDTFDVIETPKPRSYHLMATGADMDRAAILQQLSRTHTYPWKVSVIDFEALWSMTYPYGWKDLEFPVMFVTEEGADHWLAEHWNLYPPTMAWAREFLIMTFLLQWIRTIWATLSTQFLIDGIIGIWAPPLGTHVPPPVPTEVSMGQWVVWISRFELWNCDISVPRPRVTPALLRRVWMELGWNIAYVLCARQPFEEANHAEWMRHVQLQFEQQQFEKQCVMPAFRKSVWRCAQLSKNLYNVINTA